jgi:outer membrane protein assembly factor BamA
MRLAVLLGAGVLLAGVCLAGNGAPQEEVSIQEAQGHKVAEIRFIHRRDKPFRNPELRAAMLTQVGKPFQRHFFRNDLGALENLYRGEGYMGVDIAKRTLLLDERGRLHIALEIDSRGRWTVEDVGLLLSAPFDTTALRPLLKLKPGEPFRYGEVVEGERELQSRLNSLGYAQAAVHNELELDSRRHAAVVRYLVDPGKKRFFGRIAVVGDTGARRRPLHTRPGLVQRNLTFREGDLFDPEQLRRTNNNLIRTGLFRAVALNTPPGAPEDTVQAVEIRLQEKKYIHLGGNAFLNNTEPGLSVNLQHGNWLGRGSRVGLDASLGRPFQGSTLYLTERNLVGSGADLTVSAGLTDEWGNTRVFANPADSMQFALLTSNDSILSNLLLFAGPEAVQQYISASVYQYDSVERLWKFGSNLTRSWETPTGKTYQTQFAVSWTQSRTRPSGRSIGYNVPDAGEAGADTSFGDDPFGEEDPFGADDPFGSDPLAPDSSPSEPITGEDGPSAYLDYSDGKIPADPVWRELLTDRSKAVSFTLSFERDTRNNQINPSQGTFLRTAALYAIQVGGQGARVLDGDAELRYYLPLGRHLVWAQAARAVITASLLEGRVLPQVYWKEFGGEGSVRGVRPNSIQAIGGGRLGANWRNELRLRAGDLGVVAFWDRAGVWRHRRETMWAGMVDGYGAGLRYNLGVPFRLDLAWTDGFHQWRIYFSIGQAF